MLHVNVVETPWKYPPTISELDKFEETIDGFERNVSINRSKSSKNDLLSFTPGDHVEVCEGELINLQGTIIGIDGDSIRILPKHEALKDEIPFKVNELRGTSPLENLIFQKKPKLIFRYRKMH
jgi:transcription antitermination factor NusG